MIFLSFNSTCQRVLHEGKLRHQENSSIKQFVFINFRATRTTLAESRCPELLAQYCDILLRRGALAHKKYSFEDIEAKIKDVVNRRCSSLMKRILI